MPTLFLRVLDRIPSPLHGWRLIRHVLVCLILLPLNLGIALCPVTAQETLSAQVTEEDPVLVETAPVVLDGEILFKVRGVSAYPAEVRAQKISKSIEALALDESRSTQSLRLAEEGGFTMIFANNQPLMAVIGADGLLEGGIERQVLAQVYLKRIAEAVEAYREQRKATNLLFAIFYALAATGILASGWWGLRWTFNRLDAAIERRYKTRVKDFTVYKILLFQAGQMWTSIRGTLQACRFLLMFLLLYAYLNFVFRLFPWRRIWGRNYSISSLTPCESWRKGSLKPFPAWFFS